VLRNREKGIEFTILTASPCEEVILNLDRGKISSAYTGDEIDETHVREIHREKKYVPEYTQFYEKDKHHDFSKFAFSIFSL
jgi:hypothetical protein